MKQKTATKNVDFGYRQVPHSEKPKLVEKVFASVAPSYDVMNDLMSAGLHRLWKDQFVTGIRLKENTKILDVAGGTGDIAFRLSAKAKAKNIHADITVLDYNAAMLEVGKTRATDRNIQQITWKQGDATELPFSRSTWDVYTVAFGIRNMVDKQAALNEAYRVLKPGGSFHCMEFSTPGNVALKKIYDRYSFSVIPKIGELVAKDRDAYQYLVESIRQFPKPDVFAKMIEQAGFSDVSVEPILGGVVAIHRAYKL